MALFCVLLQISSLVSSPPERGRLGAGVGGGRALERVGQGVNVAVDRFVTVGEAIADDNPEIKVDMYEACKEARAAGEAGVLINSLFLYEVCVTIWSMSLFCYLYFLILNMSRQIMSFR